MNWSSSSGPEANRRRSQSVMLSLPVTVSGQTDQGPFREETHTMVVNAHGALIGLKTPVVKGQLVQIKSVASPGEQECWVNWIGSSTDGKTQCGIEFSQPAPRFWGIAFPPADWSRSAAGAMAGSKRG
jgi:hypothetical protein